MFLTGPGQGPISLAVPFQGHNINQVEEPHLGDFSPRLDFSPKEGEQLAEGGNQEVEHSLLKVHMVSMKTIFGSSPVKVGGRLRFYVENWKMLTGIAGF